MVGLQPFHLILILIVALVIFGPSRLPQIGKSMGKTIREFQSGIKGAGQGFQEEIQKPTDPEKDEPPKTE